MLDWWKDAQGTNMLAGVPGDALNPPKLTDELIVDFLWKYPPARISFNHLLPQMLPEEQDRLNALVDAVPFIQQGYCQDPKIREDERQRRENTRGFQTTGPKGGKR